MLMNVFKIFCKKNSGTSKIMMNYKQISKKMKKSKNQMLKREIMNQK